MASKKSPSIFGTLQKTTEAASAVNGEFVRQLRVSDLEDNPMNRFSMAEDEQFLSTVESVKKDGFLEDIIVTPAATEGKYRIVSGHRRVAAARKLGKTTVPCKVRHYEDSLAELRALMGANLHRRNLSPFDMARQLETLREVLKSENKLPANIKEQSELMAEQTDLSRATVERYLDLLNLDETLTAWAESGKMTMDRRLRAGAQEQRPPLPRRRGLRRQGGRNGRLPRPRPSRHRLRQGRGAAPRAAQGCAERASQRRFLRPRHPPLHRAASHPEARRRGQGDRQAQARYLPCQSRRAAPHGRSPQKQPRLTPFAQKKLQAPLAAFFFAHPSAISPHASSSAPPCRASARSSVSAAQGTAVTVRCAPFCRAMASRRAAMALRRGAAARPELPPARPRKRQNPPSPRRGPRRRPRPPAPARRARVSVCPPAIAA